MKAHLQIVLIILLSSILQTAFSQNPTLITDPPNGEYCEGSNGVLFGVEYSEYGINYTLQRFEGVWQDLENIAGNGSIVWFANYYLAGQNNDYRLIDELNNISDTIQIIEITYPSGEITPQGGTVGCAPFEICFDLSGVGNNHPSTIYDIDFGDGSPSETYSHPPPESVCHSYLTSSCLLTGEEFVVTLAIGNQCGQIPSSISGIEVYTPPIALYEVDSNGVCVGEEICFQNLSDPGFSSNYSTDAIYTWDFGDASAPLTLYSPDDVCHVYTQQGLYLVSLNVESDCGVSAYSEEIIVDACTGITVSPLNNGITIYPNPNNGSFSIELHSAHKDVINIQIVNLLGEPVYEKRNISFNKKYQETILLQNQPAGLYYVMITGKTTRDIGKVILQ